MPSIIELSPNSTDSVVSNSNAPGETDIQSEQTEGNNDTDKVEVVSPQPPSNVKTGKRFPKDLVSVKQADPDGKAILKIILNLGKNDGFRK